MDVTTGNLVTIVLRLRAAIRKTREPETRAALRSIEADLRKLLGPRVPKRVATRALGVSSTALERWLARGRLPLVRKSGSTRLELETGPFLDLAERVEALRTQGRERPLAGAFAALGWHDDPEGPRVLDEAVARLPRPNVPAHELRERFRATTPEERVRQALHLSGSIAQRPA